MPDTHDSYDAYGHHCHYAANDHNETYTSHEHEQAHHTHSHCTHPQLTERGMPVPTSLLTLNPLPSPHVSRLQTSLIRMMSTTKNLKIIPRIIIRLTILGTNDMIDLIRMSATRTQHAIITDHRILATPPVIIQHLTTRPLPTRIEPFLAMRLIPIVGHHHSSVLQEGIEPSRHRTTHFECAASTIPPPKQKNRQSPRQHSPKTWGSPVI